MHQASSPVHECTVYIVFSTACKQAAAIDSFDALGNKPMQDYFHPGQIMSSRRRSQLDKQLLSCRLCTDCVMTDEKIYLSVISNRHNKNLL